MMNIICNLEENATEDLFMDNEPETSPGMERLKAPRKLTLLNAFEWLYDASGCSTLSKEFLKDARRATKYIGKKFAITPEQSVFLSIICAETSNGGTCTMGDMANHLAFSQFGFMPYRDDLRALQRRRLVRVKSTYRGREFSAPEKLLDAISKDQELLPMKLGGLDFNEFCRQLNELVEEATKEDMDIDTDLILSDIRMLISNNSHLEISRAFLNNPIENDVDFLTFIYCVNQLANWNREEISLVQSSLDDFIGDAYEHSQLCHSIMTGHNQLVRDGLIETKCVGGFAGDSIKLTSKAVQLYLKEYEPIPVSLNENLQLKPEDIKPKELFYNAEEHDQVAHLAYILNEKNYKGICDRMERAGMRRGICILLSGGPGTGKTETVLQLARTSGRPIIQINVNDIMDKYVGETEKKATRAFKYYRRAVKNSPIAPILFFNECDQLFSRRLENIQRSVDQMNNALQNILLQQMEALEGILICTTNLVQNLDTAFERRFLYKIEFQKPSTEVKFHIWKSMLPDLSDDEANTLAETYDFSGGQIENITRKALIDKIMQGTDKLSLEQYHDYCRHELIHKNGNKARIGFF
jgi:SpoVK/Ycf46/Vps4 family AAA+-type ATPase